jgi:hypothetical protein
MISEHTLNQVSYGADRNPEAWQMPGSKKFLDHTKHVRRFVVLTSSWGFCTVGEGLLSYSLLVVSTIVSKGYPIVPA